MNRALQIHPADSVATLLDDAVAGASVQVGDRAIVARADIARGHKIALVEMRAGQDVVKYGAPIGHASHDIAPGDHVHSHNLATNLSGALDYRYGPSPAPQARSEAATFMGYRRPDGRVATRKEIWVLPTVGCVGRTAQRIAQGAQHHVGAAVDAVVAFPHPFGCSQLGGDLAATRDMLAALACNPNAAGVVIVGLGCESNQLDQLLARLPERVRAIVRTVVAQTSADEVDEGLAQIDGLVGLIGDRRREPVPLSALVLGVKCGGSDGFSGLTANPLVGRISDRLTGAGGSVVMTEIPEVFGAEHLLMNRAASETVFDGIVTMVNDFKRYFIDHGEPVSENPSPGNIAGGITTLEEKSLGAVQKGGTATVTEVIHYAGQGQRSGLALLEAPGNDAVSGTALAAAGATMILFTTGRGTPLGFPVPTVKIATNHELAARKSGWIDFDAGRVLDDGFDDAERALVDLIVDIASGRPTAAERNGEREIALWKRGVTL
jgi:altronate hydrolase